MENKTYTYEQLQKAMKKVFKTPEERLQFRLLRESVYGNMVDIDLINERQRRMDLWVINRAKELEVRESPNNKTD